MDSRSRCIKRRELKQRVLLVAFVLQSWLLVAQPNLTTNPGFETGNTMGWFAFGPPTISAETSMVHSGAYACLVTNRTSTWNGLAQSFVGVFSAGQTYNVPAWSDR
jgi:hypothetical protein